MPFPNRYEGNCVDCGVLVLPSSPDKVNGYTFQRDSRWVIRCVGCGKSAPPEPRPVVVDVPKARIVPEKPGFVAVRAASYLGDAKFAEFKIACQKGGAVYHTEGDRPVNRAPIDAVPHLITYLKEAGILVELDPMIASRLQAQANMAREAADEADSRIRVISETLAKRGERLLEFQPLGIISLAEHSPGGFLLADDMGLGKTVQALLALRDEQGAIVFTRASVVGEWLKAIRRWLPQRRALVYHGRAGMNFWPSAGEIIVASYEALSDKPPADCPQGVVLIADEAHNLKGATTTRNRRWRILRRTVQGNKGTVWALTGTPLVNDLDELWTVLQVAGLGEREFINKRKFKRLAFEDRLDFVRRLKLVMLRRLKRDVLKDLPPKIPSKVPVEITAEVRNKLDDALANIVALAVDRAEELARRDAAALRMVSEQDIARVIETARMNAQANVNNAIEMAFDGTTRPPFELIARVKSILALAKIVHSQEKLDELEESSPPSADGLYDSPLIFFSAHLEPVRMVAQRKGWKMLTGETPQDQRRELIDAFQSGKLAGLALTIKAGGEGITLTRGDKIVRNDREWTPAANKQADDRAWRFGQDQAVQIFDVCANHALDERIQELLDEKERLCDATVEQAVTRATDHRESYAKRIETVLEATTAGVKRVPPKLTAIQKWVQRGVLLLTETIKETHLKIDGPTRPDIPRLATLLARLNSQSMTPDDWELGRLILCKYQRQIGDCPNV